MGSMQWQLGNNGNHPSICSRFQGNQEKPVSRWPVAGPRSTDGQPCIQFRHTLLAIRMIQGHRNSIIVVLPGLRTSTHTYLNASGLAVSTNSMKQHTFLKSLQLFGQSRNLQPYTEPGNWFSCSLKPATGPCPDKKNPYTLPNTVTS